MQYTEVFDKVFSQNLTTNSTDGTTIENMVDFAVNENNTITWVKDVFTSDSAKEFYSISSIALLVIFIVGPIIGFLVQLFLWHVIALLICGCYQLRQRIKWGYVKIDIEELRDLVFSWWRFLGRIIYKYEVVGVENFPKDCPVVLVGFHGTFPIDYVNMFSVWNNILKGCPLPFCVGDKNQTNPGILKLLVQVLNIDVYTREELIELVQNGNWVMLTPGGENEVYYSDETYKLQWKHRKGYARVASAAKAAIVPYFTKNLQEAFRLPWYVEIVWSKKFVFSHMFSSLFSGLLPVKLTTFYGPPSLYDENRSVEELADKVRLELQRLIDDNQRIPGNQFHAVLERFCGKSNGNRTKLFLPKHTIDGPRNRELTQPLIEAV